MRKAILIIDDEPMYIKVIKGFIKDSGYECISFLNSQDAINFLNDKKIVDNVSPSEVVIAIVDLSMPDIDGISAIKIINKIKRDIQIIVLTASNELSKVTSAINSGANEYVSKGSKDLFVRLSASINNCIENRSLKQQVYSLERRNDNRVSFFDLLGSSRCFVDAVNLAKKFTNSNMPILIEGAPGCGKELLAKAIHGSGVRVGKPFVAIDCSFLSKNEKSADNANIALFGTEKFEKYGIMERSIGAIKRAEDGTVFLGNVDFLTTETQIRLLRFIQEGTFEPFGTNQPIISNARIITSTNKSLESYVKHGRFREDLYHRLGSNSFNIVMPSLMERGQEDIKMLADNFCFQFSISENKKIKGLTKESLDLLYQFSWEENVQQLKNFIFRAVLLCDGNILSVEHFPQILNFVATKPIRKKHDPNRESLEKVDFFDSNSNCKDLEQIEKEVIEKLVEYYNGNISNVSKHLKVGRSTVYRKLSIEQ